MTDARSDKTTTNDTPPRNTTILWVFGAIVLITLAIPGLFVARMMLAPSEPEESTGPKVILNTYEFPKPGPGDPAPAVTAEYGTWLFNTRGCTQCHVIDPEHTSPVAGGPLYGVYGHSIPINGAGYITADEEYIKQSIREPQSQIRSGYMPMTYMYGKRFTEMELNAIIEMMKSIKDIGQKGTEPDLPEQPQPADTLEDAPADNGEG